MLARITRTWVDESTAGPVAMVATECDAGHRRTPMAAAVVEIP